MTKSIRVISRATDKVSGKSQCHVPLLPPSGVKNNWSHGPNAEAHVSKEEGKQSNISYGSLSQRLKSKGQPYSTPSINKMGSETKGET